MSQRNFMNERYNEETRTGKTRKSSASARPKTERAGTVREPAPKTKKQKKAEARERERKQAEKAGAMESAFESTEGYKRLRRIWWVALAGAIACTALSFFFQNNEATQPFALWVMIAAYALIIFAFYIDLGKIRKERKLYNAALVNDRSKAASKERKRRKAEAREQEREAAEKFAAAKAEEEAKAAARGKGLLGRFRKPKGEPDETAGGGATSDGKAAAKPKAD